MTFEERRSERLGESSFFTVLDNGLTVCVSPMENKSGIYAALTVKFGSVDRIFALDGRQISIPAGVAHFLEHKMFENEQGEDAFTQFSRTGASANAYTGHDRTSYVFMTSIRFEESLRTLIRFVKSPAFSKTSVDKEQGIITQEIRMYGDNPDWAIFNMILNCLYANHPVRDDIAGTPQSIAAITPELLYDCYRAFYQPSNMILAVAGNVTPELVARVALEEFADVTASPVSLERLSVIEAGGVAKESASREMSVFENMFALGYKMEALPADSMLRGELTLRILTGLLTDSSSDLYRALYDEGLINDMFDCDMLSGSDYLCVVFAGESPDPGQVVARIRGEIARQKEEGVDPARFEEAKRAFLGSELCAFDSVESVVSFQTAAHFKNFDAYGIMGIIEGISTQDANDMLKTYFDESRSAVALITPAAEREH